MSILKTYPWRNKTVGKARWVRPKKTGLVLVLALLLAVVAGCAPREPAAPQGESPQATPPQTMDIAVYYVKTTADNMFLVREVHKVAKSESVATAALNELISGAPQTAGAYKVLPADTKVLGIKIDQGVATVDFSPEVLKANVGASGEALGISSIVNTLTEFPTIQKVQFTVDGSVDKGIDWWGHVGLHDQPFKRDLNSVYEPVIWVTSPTPGQSVSSPLKIRGTAMIFEAVVSYRLKDASGNVIATGNTMATAGAPQRGEFSADLAFTSGQPGTGQLEVFETSMKDGSDINKVIIPVVLP
jgi:hypothetical protein